MKTNLKKFFQLAVIVALVAVFALGVFTTAATSPDPADNYVKQTAPNEDSSINMWFDYSFRKTFTSDKTSTGMDTFSIYMAKNEIESAQFVLYSDTDKTGMSATVTDFTDANGNTVPAEIYYEMYVTTSALDTTSVLGSTASTTFIRPGETPDPVAPLAKLKTFKLNGGKSQAFLIRAKSASDTVPGWYSAQLNVLDANKQTVKTATVYCYVWDFEISEKTELKTAFYLNNYNAYGGSYQDFYNYLLENRLCAMDVPGGKITSSNSYLTNPRVSAIRVTAGGGGSVASYMDSTTVYSQYPEIYNDLSNSPVWNDIKDKLYFYTVDEPLSLEQKQATGSAAMSTVDDVKSTSAYLNHYWPGAQTVVPYHENHPYPYLTYKRDLSTYKDYEKRDATEEMIQTGSVTNWCPQLYAFTPQSEILAADYQARYEGEKIRDLSGIVSGLYSPGTNMYAGRYYNWASVFGQFDNRIKSHITYQNEGGGNYSLWAYSAGWNKSYSYCNHLIENTGLQTKMLFWQLYQNDVTGYLYYGTNNWNEYDQNNGTFVDRTVSGAKANLAWKTNKHNYTTGYSIYGNGTLFYGQTMGKVSGVPCIGSLRVEILRDGVEEYQMFKMLDSLKGNTAAKEIVGKVSNNVVNYISMPNYNRSAWAANSDDYAVMESVRRELGFAVEAAVLEGECDHEWNDGAVTVPAGCTTIGEMTYTCTKCDAVKTEVIPTKHTVGNCFTYVSGSAATCTSAGSEIYECTECGYKKTVETLAFHDDEKMYEYESRNDSLHYVNCSVCGENITSESHVLFEIHKAATCTEEGRDGMYCNKNCGYESDMTVTPALGHEYVNGVCTRCGEKEPAPEYIVGDINNDGYINAIDANLMKKMLGGSVTATELQLLSADVNDDGNFNAIDANLMKKYLGGGISSFR